MKDAVIDVVTRLFVSTDERDWAGVRACFAPEVRFDMTSLAGGQPATMTPAQIADGWKTGLAPLEAIHHQVGNFRVQVEGNQASVACYGIAYHYRKTKSGRNTRVFVGTYDFELRRAEGTWVITSFRFNSKFVDGNLTLEQD